MQIIKRTLITAISLLTGCVHLNDPRPKHYKAPITTVANKVCVIVQPEADEQIVTIRINEVGSDNNTLEKYGLAVSASAGRCVTDFNYAFAAGKAYNFMVILESPEKKKRGVQPSARIYGASFSLWRLNGKLQTTPLY
ncbi:hypothetical protein CLM71_05455 [Serratia sp. MYb239]|uniref:putative T6SS immunity periplasmic lipoprotein n=1 Tax=Serratia sp. MYb239 TaxID=2033438 RepID=UPI000CF676D6|nr:hypothetical protein CLM71_05455 [Serratia sp. MYb239]